MGYRVDLSQLSEDIVRGLINFENKTDFTADELTFNKAGGVSTTHREWLKYQRTDKIAAYYRGRVIASKIYFYNRIRLSHLLGNLGIAVPWKKHLRTVELLPYISQQLGINLTYDDIMDRLIDEEAYTIEIDVFSLNVAYVGSINVIFDGHPDSLSGRVMKRDLSGFTIENIE